MTISKSARDVLKTSYSMSETEIDYLEKIAILQQENWQKYKIKEISSMLFFSGEPTEDQDATG